MRGYLRPPKKLIARARELGIPEILIQAAVLDNCLADLLKFHEPERDAIEGETCDTCGRAIDEYVDCAHGDDEDDF